MTHNLAARYSTRMAILRDRHESGQNSLEYLGMALVAGVVIAAIYGIVSGDAVKGKIEEAWKAITSAK